MKIAFIIQNLTHISDSVGFDCIFQYRILLRDRGADDVRLFADVFDSSIHPDVVIEPFSEFWEFYEDNPDALIIYHFCDGWERVDGFLREEAKNCIVRWHNNTVPWFYALDAVDFAAGCVRGFEEIGKFARESNVRFLVNSDFSRRQLEALDGETSRIHTVFPASSFLSKDRNIVAAASGQLKSGDEPIELLFVSRVAPHKGHKHVLAVADAVKKFSGRDVHVTFVGSLEQRLKWYWSDLQAIARELELRVSFTGLVADDLLISLYQRCDVFVCLSEHEGFGIPVFEAMRCQVPVVAWATTALGELLRDHPLALTEFNIHKFAACVLSAIEQGFRERTLAVQNRILASYTYDVVVGQLQTALVGASEERCFQHIGDAKMDEELEVRLANLARKIKETLGTAVNVFPHDAPVNYMSRYDVDVYKRLVGLLRYEQANTMKAEVNRGHVDGLHPKASAIRHILSSGSAPVGEYSSLRQLLSFDDEALVRVAYATILGRQVERSALTDWTWRLRRGEGKISLLRTLVASEEARAAERTIDGLKVVLGAVNSVVGAVHGGQNETSRPAFLRAFGRRRKSQRASPELELRELVVGEDTDQDRLLRLEDAIARLRRYLLPGTGEPDLRNPLGAVHHVDDLLRLNDESFVEFVYSILLGRPSDPSGAEYWRARLKEGASRNDVLREFASTDQGRDRVDQLEGLSDLLFGSVPENLTGEKFSGRLMRLENEVGRLIQGLIAQCDGNEAVPRDRREEPAQTVLRLASKALDESRASIALGSKTLLETSAAQSTVMGAPSLEADYVVIERIHQILISDHNSAPENLPEVVRNNIASIQRMHPQAEYKLWSLADLRSFIAGHFSRDVLDAFDRLNAFALKADLGRYCLLYVLGGLYSDLSNRFVSPLTVERGKLIACFREHRPLHGALWMNQNTIIYATPKQPEIKLAIDLVVENVRNLDYGISSLAPSGPVLFGRVFAAFDRAEVYQIGEAVNLQVSGELNRACYVSADGALVAARMQGGGGRPSELGLKGTNVYGDMWEQRNIYSENKLIFTHDNPAIGTNAARTPQAIQIANGDSGVQLFGPYCYLPVGHYEAVVQFVRDTWSGTFLLDVCVELGEKILAEKEEVTLSDSGCARVRFSLAAPVAELEVRVRTFGEFSGQFSHLTIERLGPPLTSSDLGYVAEEVSQVAADSTTLPAASSGSLLIHQIVEDGHHVHGPEMENINSIQTTYPDGEYSIWTLSSLRTLISEYFSPEILSAYDNLTSFRQKSVLGRYCLLFARGGLYVDAGVRCMNRLLAPADRPIGCFRAASVVGGRSWAIDPAVIYAAPEQPEIKEALLHVVAAARDGLFENPEATGGAALGRVLAVYYQARRYFGGEVVPITRGFQKNNDCFVSFDGRLIAVRMCSDRTVHS